MTHAGDVLARIEDFTVGGPDDHEVFLAQLAEENGWQREMAVRAWREYLRFLALAASSPEQAHTPSVAVDAVWHRHLTHASYRTLQPLLGRDLQHVPTGPDEATDGPYRATIAAYTATFGPPPRDLWPRPDRPAAAPVRRRRRWLAVPYLAAVVTLVVLIGIGHPITIAVLVAGVIPWFWRQVQRERSGPLATPAPSKEAGCKSYWAGPGMT